MPEGWRICNIDGCMVAPHDPRCPACQYRLTGPLERMWVWQ